jgi:methyl-accepting chemotaxis protein
MPLSFLVIVVVLGTILIRYIFTPIKDLTGIFTEAAKGDLTVRSRYDAQDEIGTLSSSFNIFISNTGNIVKSVTTKSYSLEETSDTLTRLSNQTGESISSIRNVVDRMQASTTDSVNVIEKINAVIHDVNTIVTGIASSIEVQNDTTKNMAGNISHIADSNRGISENMTTISSAAKTITTELPSFNTTSSEMELTGLSVRKSAEERQFMGVELKDLVTKFKIRSGIPPCKRLQTISWFVSITAISECFANPRHTSKNRIPMK